MQVTKRPRHGGDHRYPFFTLNTKWAGETGEQFIGDPLLPSEGNLEGLEDFSGNLHRLAMFSSLPLKEGDEQGFVCSFTQC